MSQLLARPTVPTRGAGPRPSVTTSSKAWCRAWRRPPLCRRLSLPLVAVACWTLSGCGASSAEQLSDGLLAAQQAFPPPAGYEASSVITDGSTCPYNCPSKQQRFAPQTGAYADDEEPANLCEDFAEVLYQSSDYVVALETGVSDEATNPPPRQCSFNITPADGGPVCIGIDVSLELPGILYYAAESPPSD